jgi:multidrug efflux pump subunit AcrB
MLLKRLAVLGVTLTLPLAAGGCSEQKGSSGAAGGGKPLPVITVKAEYPGGNAQVVADSLAAPIEQQVNGVEKMRFMTSRSANDGTCTLHVAFEPGTDLDRAQALVRRRVNLALPQLPDLVKRIGVTVKPKPAGVLMFVSLFSPDGRYDALYLSNYATIQLKDELERVAGVADVRLFGVGDYSLRITLDTQEMAAHKVTASAVARAVQKSSKQRPSARGKALQVPLGRLDNLEGFGKLVVGTGPEDRPVRLKDVAAIELGSASPDRFARFNRHPAVILAFSPTWGASPREVGAALRDRLSALRARLPRGLALKVAFDFTPNRRAEHRPTAGDCLLLDADLPDSASPERTLAVLDQCQALLSKVEGVRDVLTLSEDPFTLFPNHRGCLLVGLAPAGENPARREQLLRAVRAPLNQVQGRCCGSPTCRGPPASPAAVTRSTWPSTAPSGTGCGSWPRSLPGGWAEARS